MGKWSHLTHLTNILQGGWNHQLDHNVDKIKCIFDVPAWYPVLNCGCTFAALWFHRNDVDFFPGGCEKKNRCSIMSWPKPSSLIMALGFLYSQMRQHLSKWIFVKSFFVEGFPDFYAVPVFGTALLSFCDSGCFNGFWRSLLLFWMDQICVSDKYICTSFRQCQRIMTEGTTILGRCFHDPNTKSLKLRYNKHQQIHVFKTMKKPSRQPAIYYPLLKIDDFPFPVGDVIVPCRVWHPTGASQVEPGYTYVT